MATPQPRRMTPLRAVAFVAVLLTIAVCAGLVYAAIK
jgi:hypothetical protein